MNHCPRFGKYRSVCTTVAIVVLCTVVFTAALLVPRNQRPNRALRRNPALDPQTSCGPVSLAIVTCYLGAPVPLRELHAETRAGEMGVCSMADLIQVLRKHGFSATAVKYKSHYVGNHGGPMILFVDGNHFLTAVPGHSGRVVLIDPPAEPVTTTWSALSRRWTGEAIIVGPRGDNPKRLL